MDTSQSSVKRLEMETKRSANFNSREEAVLLCLIKKYKAIIENKKTDSNNNKGKIECWKKIEAEFNSESGTVYRDFQTLRKKYENIKKKTKKKIADEKCYIMGTGGGPPKKPPEITDTDLEVKEILGERIEGLLSQFGGDAEIITITYTDDDMLQDVYTANDLIIEDQVLEDQVVKDIESEQSSKDLLENLQDWWKISIDNLKTPKSKALTVATDSSKKRKRNEYDALCSKVSHWAGAKANLESVKIKHSEEEHTTKIRLMEQKFQLETELMTKESEMKIKKIQQEMELTVEGIQEQNKLKKEILLLQKHEVMQKFETKK